MTVYLSGVSIVVNQLAMPVRLPAADPRIGSAQDGVLDVVAGQLAAGMELHALAQIELDVVVVGADVPALGQHRLGVS